MTEATQDKALQKKLVGAAVLIALAVIFLPMLFDGKKDEEPVSMQIEIPPKPVYDIPNRLERQPVEPVVVEETAETVKTIELVPSAPVIEEAPEEQAQPVAKAGADTGEQDAAVEPVRKKAVAEQKPVKQKKPVSTSQQSKVKEKKKAVKPKVAPSRVASKRASGGAGYVVQVGSFSQKANAATLAGKLVAKGFPAFVESSSTKGKSIFRVKVGPRPTREAADDLRQRLIDKQRLEGIIVSHH